MSLREQAAADLEHIIEDPDGFSVAITITSPEGATAELMADPQKIAYSIDPETGQAVSGGRASVAVRQLALSAAGLSVPRNIPETDRFPWVVRFELASGVTQAFKVIQSNPDETPGVGLVTLQLEAYQP